MDEDEKNTKVVEKVIEKVVENPKTAEELASLRAQYEDTLKKAREAEAEKERLTKQFEGIDPDVVRNLLEEKKTAEQKELEKKGEWDRIKQMMADEHKKELEKLADQVKQKDQATSKLETMLNNLTIGSAFDGSEFVRQELVLTPSKTRAVYADHFEVEDGRVVAYNAPKGASNRTKLVDGSGTPLTFEDALKKLVENDPDRDKLLKSKLREGANSRTVDRTVKETSNDSLFGVSRIAAALLDRAKKS